MMCFLASDGPFVVLLFLTVFPNATVAFSHWVMVCDI